MFVQMFTGKVTDPTGKRIPFTRRTESDGDIVLRIGSASSYVFGRVDYVISYTIGHAMVQAGDRQEIYLDVNGTGWQQPFDRVRATLRVAGWSGVQIGPGATAFTRMPFSIRFSDSERVKAVIAPLVLE